MRGRARKNRKRDKDEEALIGDGRGNSWCGQSYARELLVSGRGRRGGGGQEEGEGEGGSVKEGRRGMRHKKHAWNLALKK
jgi:hypothetical protein